MISKTRFPRVNKLAIWEIPVYPTFPISTLQGLRNQQRNYPM